MPTRFSNEQLSLQHLLTILDVFLFLCEASSIASSIYYPLPAPTLNIILLTFVTVQLEIVDGYPSVCGSIAHAYLYYPHMSHPSEKDSFGWLVVQLVKRK